MSRRLIIVLLGLFAAACASQPATRNAATADAEFGRGRYSAQPGEAPVGVIPDATIRDTQRNKDIVFTIEYPTTPGPHPMLLWSHDLGGSARGAVGLSSHWASFGYVVVKPNHADAGRKDATNATTVEQTGEDFRNRVRDLTFFIDSIAQLTTMFPELQGKIDAARIGVGGVGYGAFTAQLAGGVRTFPGPVEYGDARVKAVLAMSPQGPRQQLGLTNESWANLRVPAMFMVGTRERADDDNPEQTTQWRRQSFELSPAGDKWLVVIQGARPETFGGRVGGLLNAELPRQVPIDPYHDPRDPRDPNRAPALRDSGERGRVAADTAYSERGLFNRVRVVSLAFWDTYLRPEAQGRQFLNELDGRVGIEVATR